MTPTRSESPTAAVAIDLVEALQSRFKDKLEATSRAEGSAAPFEAVAWARDEGHHGGGMRYQAALTPMYNRVAINVSHVHYEDQPEKRLRSATALSTIIHPHNPRAPSVHMHFSWTELRDGGGYWRLMADLNPSIPDDAQTATFAAALQQAAPRAYDEARAQGDQYFFIPALGRHRGVTHFYLEAFSTGDFEQDRALTQRVAEAAIDRYIAVLAKALREHREVKVEDQKTQLAYHTVYFFQVLTLDRGTTSGLLVHDQNDLGILGSLPSFVDRQLLASWEDRMPDVQRSLLRGLVAALPEAHPSPVTPQVRGRLAEVVRGHYRAHPEAMDLQAAGHVVPPTVEQHQGR